MATYLGSAEFTFRLHEALHEALHAGATRRLAPPAAAARLR